MNETRMNSFELSANSMLSAKHFSVRANTLLNTNRIPNEHGNLLTAAWGDVQHVQWVNGHVLHMGVNFVFIVVVENLVGNGTSAVDFVYGRAIESYTSTTMTITEF